MADLTPNEFAIALGKWCELAKRDVDEVCRITVFKIFSGIVLMSPVGNPELWAANSRRVNHNKFIASYNSELRNNPANFTARGYLRRGLKATGTLPLIAGKHYVGGRFRAAWSVSVEPNVMPPPEDVVDPQGAETIERGDMALRSFKAGGVIYLHNPLPYATRLEFGWSHKQAPHGMVRVTLAGAQQMFEDAIKQIQSDNPESPS